MAFEVIQGDCRTVLAGMAEKSVQLCVTSPPYWGLRDYGIEPSTWGDGHKVGFWCGVLGLEPTPELFIQHIVEVFRAVRRVLRDDGILMLNLGDSYTSGNRTTYRSGVSDNKGHQVQDDMPRPGQPPGLKPKDLIGIPWRCALALQADGWWLRSDIIWSKPNPMPESVTDRPTRAHEYMFLLTKSSRYFWDAEAVREKPISNYPPSEGGAFHGHSDDLRRGQRFEGLKGRNHCVTPVGGRNLRSVWTIPTYPFPAAHFATFPPRLVEPCIKAGTSERGCCPKCSKPWRRVVEKNRQPTRPARDNVRDETGMANRDYERHVTETKTVGWEPGCQCVEPGVPDFGDDRVVTHSYPVPVPCKVLDPFAGSGTVGLVAEHLGRDSVLVEMSDSYCGIMRRRIAGGYVSRVPDKEREWPTLLS